MIDAHKHFLECLSKTISDEKLALLTEKKVKHLKTNNASTHRIERATRSRKQDFGPKLYAPKKSFMDQMRD